MIAVIGIILLTMGISILAGAKEELDEAFSNPNWMNKEEKQ